MSLMTVIANILMIVFVKSEYTLNENYTVDTFKSYFSFSTFTDFDNCYVEYEDKLTAMVTGIYRELTDTKQVYIGVDAVNTATTPGRRTVWIESQNTYNVGLFILDLAHMPASVCGTWPLFFLAGRGHDWPDNGRINVIEGINNQKANLMSLYTGAHCQIDTPDNLFNGHLVNSNCSVAPGSHAYNSGCQIQADQSVTYGDDFNKNGGGVYAVELLPNSIIIWHFPRSKIPSDITNNIPNPRKWSEPIANFSGKCDFSEKFLNLAITFTIKFCGDWINDKNDWNKNCGTLAETCEEYVKKNPQAFNESYWLINSLNVYVDRSINHDQNEQSTTLRINVPKKPPLALYIGIPAGVSAIIFLIILIACCRRRQNKNRQKAIYALMDGFLRKIGVRHAQKKLVEDPWRIHKENLIVCYNSKLGKGAFSDVYVGELIGDSGAKRVYRQLACLSHFHDCKVAVKVSSNLANEADTKKEIAFMQYLKYHPHLVCLLGYIHDSTNIMIVLEYCQNGDLLNYVKSHKNNQSALNPKQLISFAWQIANGLDYFTSLDLIHRDIAARNVLLDENNVCKIGDFGLCRIANDKIYKSRGGKLPFRWLAIESIEHLEYSTKTDIWAYGILLQELFSFGDAPYQDLEDTGILKFLKSGKRMEKTPLCPNEIYNLILNCWKADPTERPNFSDVCQEVAKMLEVENYQYNYVDVIKAADLTGSDHYIRI